MARYPTTDFDHLDREFRTNIAVDDDDAMVLARPDLFAAKRARTSTNNNTDTNDSSGE